MREAKRTLMGEALAFQSFNSSYHSRFPELLLKAYELFDHVSVLNFRLDTLAASVRQDGADNYLRVMKELGAVVVAGAVEGLGERVRNNLYNKNLSFQDILCVAGEVFRLKFMKFKTGYILSGHETGNDLKDGLGEIREVAGLKRGLCRNTQYVVSVSKLVHHYGTPVYTLPRVASYLNWTETFGGKEAHYPFMDLPRELVTVRSVSGIGGTFVQQLHQDLPSELSREILLEPALEFPVMGRGYLDEVKRRMEARGIVAKNQFLDFDSGYSPKQHYKLSPAQELIGGRIKEHGFKPVLPCLKTRSSVERGETPACHGCRACVGVDEANPRLPSFYFRKEGESHRDFLFGRELGPSVSLSRVKAVRSLSEPSFFYSFIFQVAEEGRLVSKDALARLWIKAWAEEDSSVVSNFRRFTYSFAAHMDYPDMVSNYFGFEAVVAGFKNSLDLAGLEGVKEKVNGRCPTIKLVRVFEVHEKPSVPGYWILSELCFREPEWDRQGFMKCFLNFPFRRYIGSTSKYQEVSLPFYYCIYPSSRGERLRICLPGKVNPAFSLLELWHYNKFNKMLEGQRIVRVLVPLGGGNFIDVVTGKVESLEVFNFVDHVEAAVSFQNRALEVQGS
jgi:hypothetical protein